jgi:hypothetical protein
MPVAAARRMVSATLRGSSPKAVFEVRVHREVGGGDDRRDVRQHRLASDRVVGLPIEKA